MTGLLTYSADGGVAHRTLRSRRHEVSSDKRCDVVGLAQEESIELDGFFRKISLKVCNIANILVPLLPLIIGREFVRLHN